MKRACRKCREKFECREGKPGHIDDYLNCIQDPERPAKLSGEIAPLSIGRHHQIPGLNT